MAEQEVSYRRCIKQDMKLFKIDHTTWRTACRNRSKWRAMLHAGREHALCQWHKTAQRKSDVRHERELRIPAARANRDENYVVAKTIVGNKDIFQAITAAVQRGHITVRADKRRKKNKLDLRSRTSRMVEELMVERMPVA